MTSLASSADQASVERCLVCGEEIVAGQGIPVMHAGEVFHLKCEGCVSRFVADPDRYVREREDRCCQHDVSESPASEWT
jgi:hypothetical protein